MIEWRFTPDDVARVRFAFSPLLELVLSLIVLRAPARHSLHLPWVRSVAPLLADLDLSELFALVPTRGITADFLTPPPGSSSPDLASELDIVRRTPEHRVLDDLVDVAAVPQRIVSRIRDRPRDATLRIADSLNEYWDIALASSWPRIQALLEADVLWRSRHLALGGTQAVFDDLDDSVVWRGDRLSVTDPWTYSGALAGEGLLLVPSVMAWPTVRKMVEPYQPAIAYPARGIATLWDTEGHESHAALGALLGRTRARVLAALAEPATTTALANRLAVTPGGVSQHLSVLRSNGLVRSVRVAGSVFYRRTAIGDSLVESTAEPV